MRRKNVRIKKELQNGIQKGIVVSVLAAITVVALSFSIPQEAQVRAACIPPTPGCFNEDLVPDAPNVRNIGQTFPDLDWKSLYLSGFTYLGPLTSDPSDWQFGSLYYNITSNSFRFTDNGGVWKSIGINSITTLGDLIAGNDSGEFSQFAAGTESQILKTNGTGEDPYWTTLPSGQGGGLYSFGGDGSDGVYDQDTNPGNSPSTISVSTEVLVKNYSSFNLDADETLKINRSLGNTKGVLFILRVKGDATINGKIDLNNAGGKGGTGGNGAGAGTDGQASSLYFDNLNHFGQRGLSSALGAGGAAAEIPQFYITDAQGLYKRPWGIVPGSGGGGGYGIGCTGGNGGQGGGSLILEVKGNITFNGSIYSHGGIGQDRSTAACAVTGGGGGAGGSIFIIYGGTASGSGGSTAGCPDNENGSNWKGLCIKKGSNGDGTSKNNYPGTLYGPGGGANLGWGEKGGCGTYGANPYEGLKWIEPEFPQESITGPGNCENNDNRGGGRGSMGVIIVVKNRWLGINP